MESYQILRNGALCRKFHFRECGSKKTSIRSPTEMQRCRNACRALRSKEEIDGLCSGCRGHSAIFIFTVTIAFEGGIGGRRKTRKQLTELVPREAATLRHCSAVAKEFSVLFPSDPLACTSLQVSASPNQHSKRCNLGSSGSVQTD